MAIWDFRASLIPRNACDVTSAVGNGLTRDSVESRKNLWSPVSLAVIVDALTQVGLSPMDSWSSRIQIWSDQQSGVSVNLICDDEGKLVWVSCEVDARMQRAVEAAQIITHLCRSLECRLLLSSGNVESVDSCDVAATLQSSIAWKYVIDPKECLNRMAAAGNELDFSDRDDGPGWS